MKVLLGIDDTDDAKSRGTGYHARQIGALFSSEGLAGFLAVTRHQLLLSAEIPYTSRNSAACLVLECDESAIEAVRQFARKEVRAISAVDSDAGISLALDHLIDGAVEEFGFAAKHKVLSMGNAHELARRSGITLEEVGGSGAGAIGALAAIGLHHSGNDGRFIWLPGLRRLTGKQPAGLLVEALGVEVATLSGEIPPPSAEIEMGDWMRPVLRQGRAILLAEKEDRNGQFTWRLLDKETIKAISG